MTTIPQTARQGPSPGHARRAARVTQPVGSTGLAGSPTPPLGEPATQSSLPLPTNSHRSTAAGTQTPAGAGRKRRAAGQPPALAGLQAAAMSEDDLEENVRDACKKLGILRFHVHISKGTTAGLPDDILIGPRGILWRELKNQTRTPTPAQVKAGEALMAIGQDWALWRPSDWFSGRIERELRAISGLRVAGGTA